MLTTIKRVEKYQWKKESIEAPPLICQNEAMPKATGWHSCLLPTLQIDRPWEWFEDKDKDAIGV